MSNICYYCGEYKDVIKTEKLVCGDYDVKGNLTKRMFIKHRYKMDKTGITRKKKDKIHKEYE